MLCSPMHIDVMPHEEGLGLSGGMEMAFVKVGKGNYEMREITLGVQEEGS